MCVVNELRNVATCPLCKKTFAVEDIHKPARCPGCGAVLTFRAPDFEPEVLYSPGELVGADRA